MDKKRCEFGEKKCNIGEKKYNIGQKCVTQKMKKWTKRYDFGTQLGKIVRRINCKIRQKKKEVQMAG